VSKPLKDKESCIGRHRIVRSDEVDHGSKGQKHRVGRHGMKGYSYFLENWNGNSVVRVPQFAHLVIDEIENKMALSNLFSITLMKRHEVHIYIELKKWRRRLSGRIIPGADMNCVTSNFNQIPCSLSFSDFVGGISR
jgi:hypothetical protein